MSKDQQAFTYEVKAQGELETYEWDSPWWEKNRDLEHARVMYLGDSISWGTCKAWNQTLSEQYYCDVCSTSKAIDNRFLLPLATQFLQQMVKTPEMILVNNGLHGFHLSSEDYAVKYKEFLQAFKAAVGDIPIVLLTTTSVSNEERNALVRERNAKAVQIAEELKIPVIDLYPLSETLKHTDGVHLAVEGYTALAEKICQEWENDISKR